MRHYQTIDPTDFHAVQENVKKGGGLGGAATPESRDISRETPSKMHAPYIANQQTSPHYKQSSPECPGSSPHIQCGLEPSHWPGRLRSQSTFLVYTGQGGAGMPINLMSPQKPPGFTGGTLIQNEGATAPCLPSFYILEMFRNRRHYESGTSLHIRLR